MKKSKFNEGQIVGILKEVELGAKVAADVTESIVRHTSTDASYICVTFEDVKASDWAGSGKLYGEPAPTP